MKNHPKIYVAGHSGMVGSAIIRRLIVSGVNENNIITETHSKLDLKNQDSVYQFFKKGNFDQVYLAAAKVGGIHANNSQPADFIYDNLMISANIINSAFKTGVRKLMYLGSSCIYPKEANQPMAEQELLTGILEPTNEPYAIAKIAGIKLCESYNRQYGKSHGIDYRCVMPCNLYGPGDNYHPLNSHVIPALIRKFHESKVQQLDSVEIWGSGLPKREFLYVDDMAEASIFVMNLEKKHYLLHTSSALSHINVGFGEDLSIQKLSNIIKMVTNYNGKIRFNTEKPDGTMRKLMDNSRIKAMGWSPKIDLKKGLTLVYSDFLKNVY